MMMLSADWKDRQSGLHKLTHKSLIIKKTGEDDYCEGSRIHPMRGQFVAVKTALFSVVVAQEYS